jgi:hypothetical protein
MMVLELRQYTLHGGRRDELIELFEREFIIPQNAVGAHVVGSFRDLDDPDRFVWLRSFRDMAARPGALEAFYDGPVWAAHRSTANATMLDSGNVLLLKPFAEPAATGSMARPLPKQPGVLRLTLHYLGTADPLRFAEFFDAQFAPRIAARGIPILGRFVTEASANNFPRLPVREGEAVFAWLARLDSAAAERTFSLALAADSGWRDGVSEQLLPALMRKPEVLRLAPTASSALR